MYTKEQRKKASRIIARVAQEQGVSEAEVRAEMENAMNQARLNPDPVVRAHWASFSYAGAEPTIEEFILWAASRL